MRRKLIDALVAHGVRAQLRTGNLLTGSVFVALDFFPGAPRRRWTGRRRQCELPTIPGQLQVMETKITDVINKLDKMPLQQIGDELTTAIAELDQTLVAARGTLVSARGTLTNTASITEPNSAQIQQLAARCRR